MKTKLPRGFFWSFVLRNFKDLFSPLKKMESRPIVVNSNELRVWMVGHATVLINLYGTTFLTDPVLVNGIPYPRRIVLHGYKAGELPFLDYVLVSHAHLDHLNKASLRMIASKTGTLVLPRNCSDLANGMGFKRVLEMDWGKIMEENGIKISIYKVKHWGERYPWQTINRGYNGYMVEKKEGSFYFGGDTGYGEYFKEIGQRHKIDLALLPISAYNPSVLRHHHMNPEDAMNAARDLGVKHVIPIHWGNFRLSLESLFEPPEWFMKVAEDRGMGDKAHLLHNGETFSVPKRIA